MPGYYVSTVGRDEATIREYIERQDQEDRRIEGKNIKKRFFLPFFFLLPVF